MASKEAAAAATAAETDEERTSRGAAATATVSGPPEWELQSASPQPPQIECPPCTLRGSTLPVCGLLAEAGGGPSSRRQPQQQPRPPTSVVRGNRASELRRQRSLQRELVLLDSDTAAVDDLTATTTVDAEAIDHDDGSEAAAEADAADTDSTSTSTRDSDEAGSDDSSDEAADAGSPTFGEVAADLSKLSLVTSLLKSSDSVIREVNDLFLDSLDISATRTITGPSAWSKRRATDGHTYTRSPRGASAATAAAAAASPTGLNVAKLQAQLLVASRQRDLLKLRIASLARVMSSGSGVVDEQESSAAPPPDTDAAVREGPVDRNLSEEAAEAEPRHGLQPQPTPMKRPASMLRSRSTSVGVQATDSGSESSRQVADKTTQLVDERLEALVGRVQTAAETCAELRLDRAAARRELDAARFDLRMASADAQETRSALTGLRRELELREERIRQLTVAQSRVETDSGRLRSQLAEMRRQLDSAENSCQTELARNQRQRAQLTSLEAQLASRMGELSAVTNALIEKRRSEDDLLARVQQLQRALAASEETVARLTEQLTEEQARLRARLEAEISQRLQQQEQQQESPSSPLEPQPQPQPQTSQTPQPKPPLPETAGLLEQRMSELDARIGRLVAEARDGGWRRLHQEQQQQQQQQQQQPRSSDVVTSTPVDPPSSRAAAVSDVSGVAANDATFESLRLRTAQLEESNRQLTSDVRSLRGLCSELVASRRQLKGRLSLAEEQPTQPQAQTDLASYLLETETLRALISSQVRAQSQPHSPGGRRLVRQQPLLAEELQLQQETVNRCWRAVERSFQLPPQSDDAREAGAYRDFYLKRRPQSQSTGPGAAAAVSYSSQVLRSMRTPLTK